MEIKKGKFEISSSKRFDVIDITPQVEETTNEKGIEDGLAIVTTRHTSAAVSSNENDKEILEEYDIEGGLFKDIPDFFSDLVPPEAGYTHDETHYKKDTQANTHAHLLSAMLNQPVIFEVKDGELGLGEWETVLFMDFDGPRDRKVHVFYLT